jgi:ABC-type transport system substrate-binding protein
VDPKNNTAGGGAYKVEAWRPGQEIIYVRYDDWKSGKLPAMRRIIQREVPSRGQSAGAARQGRHRHDLRDAAQGLRRDGNRSGNVASRARRSRTRCSTSA